MKKLLLFCIVALCLQGCSTLNNAFTFAQRNPTVVRIATTQAVFRYIDAGVDEQSKQNRANKVVEVVRSLTGFLDANPTATTGTLITVVNNKIDWNNLTPADRLLVRDIMSLVQINLEAKEKEGLLSPNTILHVKSLLNVVKTTASLL